MTVESNQPGPIARNLPTAEVAVFLRSLVGLPPTDGEGTMVAKRSAPQAVDATAWIAWALAGLYACALPSTNPGGEDDGEPTRRGPWAPSIRTMVREARRAAVVVAMHRHGGNLTHAATALGTSRRALRDTLKTAGLYPWGGVTEDDDESEDEASATSTDASATPTEASAASTEAAKEGE